jgi:hypothetical protein
MDCIRTLQLTGSQVTQHHIIVRTGLTSSHCPTFHQQTLPLRTRESIVEAGKGRDTPSDNEVNVKGKDATPAS